MPTDEQLRERDNRLLLSMVARQEGKMSKPDDYRMTATFTITYTGEFAENFNYIEAEKIMVNWLAKDILNGRLSVSKFDRKVDVEHDYQVD